MAHPISDLVGVLRRIFRFARYAGLVLLSVTLILVVRELVGLNDLVSRVHPALGLLFTGLVALLLIRLLGVPLLRFLRLPATLRPPELPEREEDWRTAHVLARLDFLTRYLNAQRRNPALAEKRGELRAVLRDLAVTAGRIGRSGDPLAARAEVARFERERVDPLLEPLDREVDRLIRSEALSVGVATAVSPNGTLDAFLVLWRNANLVSRIANVYYGRPGVRGSLVILRDVSGAALLASYLEGISEAVGGILRGVLGSFAGVVARPVVDGAVNAIATLRIGYLAKARCRSFRAWTEGARKQALLDAVAATKDRSQEVLAGIVKAAGGSVSAVTGKIGGAVKDGMASVLRKLRGEEEAGPAPAGAE